MLTLSCDSRIRTIRFQEDRYGRWTHRISLGIMGMPMARNLLRAGHRVVAYNRTASKAETLATESGETVTVTTSPREVAKASPIIITMVTDSPDVEQVVLGPEGIIEGIQRDAVLIVYGDQVTAPDTAPLATLQRLLSELLEGLISGVHILPFFPYSSDDGFSVIDYRQVDPALGSWAVGPQTPDSSRRSQTAQRSSSPHEGPLCAAAALPGRWSRAVPGGP